MSAAVRRRDREALRGRRGREKARVAAEKAYELGKRLGHVAREVTPEEQEEARRLRAWSRGEAAKDEAPPAVEKG